MHKAANQFFTLKFSSQHLQLWASTQICASWRGPCLPPIFSNQHHHPIAVCMHCSTDSNVFWQREGLRDQKGTPMSLMELTRRRSRTTDSDIAWPASSLGVSRGWAYLLVALTYSVRHNSQSIMSSLVLSTELICEAFMACCTS